ncbi:MAG: NUDIX hydrolase [Pseudomonadota bacterium]
MQVAVKPGPMKHREAGAGLDLAFTRRPPAGDAIPRDICDHCGLISYDNPKIVVGSVVTFQNKFLLCRRAIEPRKGFWTFPAGFMEHGESVEEGAMREAREEANISIRIRDLLAVYSIPRLSQVQIMYRAEMLTSEFSAGVESLEVALFDWADIPWEELAFPSVYWALKQFQEVADHAVVAPFGNPTDEAALRFPPGQPQRPESDLS